MPLPEPVTEQGRAGLAALLTDPGTALVAVDFDGTLAPIVDAPEEARALPAVPALLTRLVDLVGTVAIITGRPVAQALTMAGLDGVEHGVVVLGQYGGQRWDAAAATVTSEPPPPGLADVISKLPDVLAALKAPPEVAIEDKGIAVAVHTRQVAEPGVWVERLRGPLVALATRHDLVVERGRFVLELRAPGRDKGGALLGLVAERSATSVLFAGDDLGDLAAYEAVDDLRLEGIPGLLVCSGSTEVTELAGRADLVVDGPIAVVGLLEELVEALAGPTAQTARSR